MSEPTSGTLVIDNFCNETNWKHKELIMRESHNRFTLYCHPQNVKNVLGFKYTTIYLNFSSGIKDQITVRYQIAILNANGDKCDAQDRVETFSKKNPQGGLYLIKFDNLASLENEFLVNGKLSVYCEIEESDSNKSLSKTQFFDNPIAQDYQSLLESGKFSDAVLIVGEKRLLVHKAILSSRSKVFADIFANDCENEIQIRQNRIKITDMTVEVCQQMLSYVYTGQIPDMAKYACDLFATADKYQLDHLKSVCVQHLSKNICVSSAANTLLIADMHLEIVLKLKCIAFIVDNANEVMATEGWKVLSKSRGELVVDLFHKLAIKNNR